MRAGTDDESSLWLSDKDDLPEPRSVVRPESFSMPGRSSREGRAAPVREAVKGRFTGLRGLVAHGWAYNPADPLHPVSVELLDEDRVIASGVADLLRDDAAVSLDSQTRCGFRIRIPNASLDGRRLQLKVREVASGTELDGPPSPPASPEQPGWSVAITDVEERTLTGRLELESSDAEDELELELWIDGIWADRFPVPIPRTDRDLVHFRHPIPESIRDGETWTSVLDGEPHEFVLMLADSSRLMAEAVLRTPSKAWTYAALQTNLAARLDELPRFVRRFIERVASSALFDPEYYAAKVREAFPNREQALLHYLADRKHWRHATSPWLDVAFVNALAGDEAKHTASPLEWYLRQGSEADVGPNPLFSNADFTAMSVASPGDAPTNASFFDDWLETVRSGTPVNPSVLVDLDHIRRRLKGGSRDAAERVLVDLMNWLGTKPKDRPLDRLSLYFDSDWLEQCFLLRHNRPGGCLLSAFRLGGLGGQSPHPVLQHSQAGYDYYAAIRAYELLRFSHGLDDVTRVCPTIDAESFYAQFPRAPLAPGASAERGSSFYRYLTADPATERGSFLSELEDAFVATAYPGLVEYCTRLRGIADINRIWARWLRLLGVPGNYADSVSPGSKLLSFQDIKQVRSHRSRLDGGVLASFIIPSYGRDDLVMRCVLSALQSGPMDRIEIIVAEDAMQVDANWILGYFMPYASIYKNPENLGFLLSCREAASRSVGPIFLLVNNDVIVHTNGVDEILAAFDSRPDAAVVGGLVLNADGTIQENGGMLWRDASAWNYHRGLKLEDEFVLNVREADYVSGCWIGFRRSVWDEIGGFDTRYAPAYYEESDFCLSVWRQGYKVYITPLSVVTHLDGATMGQDEDDSSSLKAYQKINRRKFYRKWGSLIEATNRENAKPTVFHTGRDTGKRFISLVFDHYIPEPDRDAGSRTMLVVCQALAAIEGNYVLFIPANNHRNKYALGLERLGIEVITGVEGWKRFDALLTHHTDLIRYAFISRIGVAEKFTWHINQLKCRKSLYIHDIEALRGFHHDPEAPGYDALVKAALDRYAERYDKLFAAFDDIVSLSEDETRLLQPYFGKKLVDVFPYDFVVQEPTAAASERNDIIFVGSYNHPPNREAIANFIETIWPDVHRQLPKATLHLCGSGFENAESLSGPNVVRHGMVSDKTLAYLYSISRVAIAPLLSGAGMKGKVIEASAHGVPCVGTELAWQGIDLPESYSSLCGDIDTYRDRLLKEYNAFSAKTPDSLRNLYRAWRQENRMSAVLPALLDSHRTGDQIRFVGSPSR